MNHTIIDMQDKASLLREVFPDNNKHLVFYFNRQPFFLLFDFIR